MSGVGKYFISVLLAGLGILGGVTVTAGLATAVFGLIKLIPSVHL